MKTNYVILLLLSTILACKNTPKNTALTGYVFGTSYNIQYYSEVNYKSQIDSLFNVINQSLSTYIPTSDISKINRNEAVKVDKHFKSVFKASKLVYRYTEGAFDPTIGNVVNAWNFGAETNKFETDSTTIDSLMNLVGFNKIGIVNGNTIKKSQDVYLEFNAIAKGYAIDVVSNFLKSKGSNNHLVEIGGDLIAVGINKEKNKPWVVGIDNPNFDGTQSYSKTITLQDKGMATSGTYRKYKVDKNGNRYAHIINTKTGYPTKTNILSVSVIAPNAMLADAYATAFQAMGIDKVTWFLNTHPELQVYFIFLDKNNTLNTLALNNFPLK